MLMEIKFPCPSCTQRISATEAHIGTFVDCPACSHAFEVPASVERVQPARTPKAVHLRDFADRHRMSLAIGILVTILVLGSSLWLRQRHRAEAKAAADSFVTAADRSWWAPKHPLPPAEAHVLDALGECYVEIETIEGAAVALHELSTFPGGTWAHMSIDQAEAANDGLQRTIDAGLASQKTVKARFADIKAAITAEWTGTAEIRSRILALTDRDSDALKSTSALSSLKSEIRDILAQYKLRPKTHDD